MSFQPHGKTHAVDAAIFQAFLTETLTPQIISGDAFGATPSWAKALPGRRDVQPSMSIDLSQGRPEPSLVVGGTEFVLFQPDGSPAWLLRFAPDHIAVECHIYTRWAQVWASASAHLSQGLSNISQRLQRDLSVARFVLQVTDRFASDGATLDLSALIQANEFVAPVTATRQHAWHSHVGWFDKTSPDWTLQNLNVDVTPRPARDVAETPDGWQVKILHFQRRHFAQALAAGSDIAANTAALSVHANTMHLENKRVVRSVLTEQAARQIGLHPETGA